MHYRYPRLSSFNSSFLLFSFLSPFCFFFLHHGHPHQHHHHQPKHQHHDLCLSGSCHGAVAFVTTITKSSSSSSPPTTTSTSTHHCLIGVSSLHHCFCHCCHHGHCHCPHSLSVSVCSVPGTTLSTSMLISQHLQNELLCMLIPLLQMTDPCLKAVK